MADTIIKPDPEGAVASPRFMEDDDIYEDAGDMAINEEPGFQKLWLGRVPKYVWDAWEGLVKIWMRKYKSELYAIAERGCQMEVLRTPIPCY
ncbi:hypothetical protein DID88_005908 [Monilinia fructigena]|uniref:Uncharacterized protein n=1 Tax=Monilinia fructigena TaxID=38457 RepID=A0A395J150_9HELO|nr:hypothetical protein DID88_005908 [Monilinia fructigena]